MRLFYVICVLVLIGTFFVGCAKTTPDVQDVDTGTGLATDNEISDNEVFNQIEQDLVDDSDNVELDDVI